MYEFGIGVAKNIESSFKCFKAAAQRGNVYAMGNLALHYYKNKMFNNACEVAKRFVLKLTHIFDITYYIKVSGRFSGSPFK